MRAIHTHISDGELAWRKERGLDRRDEMWEGVLHMTPAPMVEHQRVLDKLIQFLAHVERTGRGRIVSGINVFRGDEDYRIPDLTFVAAGRDALLARDGVRGGGPDAVIEIRSPHDETHEKLGFYAAIGTREVIVVDRDTKQPEIFRSTNSQLVLVQADLDGWLVSETLQVRFRSLDDAPPGLEVQDAIDPSIHTQI